MLRQITTAINTVGLPPQERSEAIRAVVWESVIKIEIDHHRPPEDIVVDLRIGCLGALSLCTALSTPITIRRTEQLARCDDDPPIFLGLQRSGTGVITQGGREALLHPGDFALFDAASEYRLLFLDGMDTVFFRVPRAVLGASARQFRDATAVTLGSGSAVAKLTSTYLTQLATTGPPPYGQHGVLIAEPTVDLIRATVAAHLDDPDLCDGAATSTLPFQIMSYLRTHLTDPELTPTAVAEAHHISLRYLYRILGRCGVRFGEWVRQNRLEGAQKDLTRPACQSQTISTISHRWGFTDSTHFSKAFKQEYGMSPREWRAHNPEKASHTPADNCG
jgi:AraC-like DNA-binding protein